MKQHINSKSLLTLAIIISLLGINLIACGDKDEIEDEELIAVKNLNAPMNGDYIVLQSVTDLLFEWSKSETKDVNYTILFDKENGNFSAPIYKVSSDNAGANTNIRITQCKLKDIATAAGGTAGNNIKLKWAIQTTKGLKSILSEEFRSITFALPADLGGIIKEGEKLYITGEGAEDGQEVKKVEYNGSTIYEIYTKLEANKPYSFYSQLGEQKRTFNLKEDGITLNETTGQQFPRTTVTQTGTYRIRLNFNTYQATTERINKVAIRFSWTGRENEFNYTSKGCWELKDYNVQLFATDWGFDERYKIIFTINEQEEAWGQLGPEFGQRPAIDRPGYRDMAPTATGQWDGAQFKFPAELCDENDLGRYYTTILISMTAEKNYTHDFLDITSHGDYTAKYQNPVFTDFSLPDPDVIRGEDGYFYLYATEHSLTDPNMKNAPIMKSQDLINWTRAGSIFTDATHPQITGVSDAGIWAPTVSKVNGKYIIYYSQPAPEWKHAIGVATSSSPTGPFTDHGKLIDSNEQGVDISIDAYLYQEDGRNYLFWGSFREISVIELTADGMSIKKGAVRKKVAGGQYEAAYVIKRNGVYNLILSTGQYHKGGTYSLVVGQSNNIMGPYTNKKGEDMNDVKHELMLKGNNRFSSTGHCSRIITDDAGQDWILYHGYVDELDYRCLMLDKVNWINGWPVVNNTYPTYTGYSAPVFR